MLNSKEMENHKKSHTKETELKILSFIQVYPISQRKAIREWQQYTERLKNYYKKKKRRPIYTLYTSITKLQLYKLPELDK